jgi:hypothetical protein
MRIILPALAAAAALVIAAPTAYAYPPKDPNAPYDEGTVCRTLEATPTKEQVVKTVVYLEIVGMSQEQAVDYVVSHVVGMCPQYSGLLS